MLNMLGKFRPCACFWHKLQGNLLVFVNIHMQTVQKQVEIVFLRIDACMPA